QGEKAGQEPFPHAVSPPVEMGSLARGARSFQEKDGGRNPPVIRWGVADPIIRLQGVSKSFDEQVVLDGIDLEIFPGETMVIMGGSGSGKSTTLRLMIGSFPPDSGSIELFGKNICELDEEGLNEVRKR